MAELADVQAALVSLIYTSLYPNAAPPSVLNQAVKIYAGWPDPGTLTSDLAPTGSHVPPNGPPTALHVSIFPLPGEKNTTRYPASWTDGPLSSATYTITRAGATITVGGTGAAYVQNLAVFVNGKPYLAQSTGAQTPSQLAATLQALIVADVAGTTVAGPVITLPATARIGALRVGTGAVSSKEVRRQERRFQITLWTDAPANRTALCAAFDPVLADTPFLPLSDGSSGRLHYAGSMETDADQKQGIYRRDLFYTVEYGTQRTQTAPQIVAITENLQDAQGHLIQSTNV